MAAATVTDRALILRRFRYGESSLVLQVLAERRGRVHLIARGAYRPKSRYYAALDLFDTLELEWSATRGRELQNLREAAIDTRRARIAYDLDCFRAAASALELVSLAARPDQGGEELFALLSTCLDALAELSPGPPGSPGPHARTEPGGPLREARGSPAGRIDLVLARFELGLLAQLGLMPSLAVCAACGSEAPADERGRCPFSAGAGGRLCAPCAAEARSSGRRVGTMPAAVLEAARDLAGGGPSPSGAATMSGREVSVEAALAVGPERVRDLLARFLEYQLESRPKSYRQFLSAPNRNRPQPTP